VKHLRLAFSFLTTLPVRADASVPAGLGRAAAWFPFVGLVLGALLSAAHFLLSQTFAPLLAAALTVALWATLTGGLHLDGLADCCDGLLASAAPERRLEIMRDPRTGAFGVIGLVLFLVLKILAVAYLLPPLSIRILPGLIAPFTLAAVLARWLILIVARQPPARPGGLGAGFALGLTPLTLALAALIPLALIAGLAFYFDGWRILRAALFAHLIAFAVIAFARARLGGVTGDVLGLTVELAELTVLLTFAANPPSLGI
jgi:adenosylcobinamide-GDP ribazoletransferase